MPDERKNLFDYAREFGRQEGRAESADVIRALRHENDYLRLVIDNIPHDIWVQVIERLELQAA